MSGGIARKSYDVKPLELTRPDKNAQALSMQDLIVDEELPSTAVEDQQGDDAGFFTEAEAIKKLQAMGYTVTPPTA